MAQRNPCAVRMGPPMPRPWANEKSHSAHQSCWSWVYGHVGSGTKQGKIVLGSCRAHKRTEKRINSPTAMQESERKQRMSRARQRGTKASRGMITGARQNKQRRNDARHREQAAEEQSSTASNESQPRRDYRSSTEQAAARARE